MMWSKISCGLCLEDANVTLNIPTVAETAAQIYKTKTVAIIESNLDGELDGPQVQFTPHVFGKLHEDTHYLIAVENSLIRFPKGFDEYECTDFLFCIRHFATIGNLIFVLLENGDVFGLGTDFKSTTRVHLKRFFPKLGDLASEDILSMDFYEVKGKPILIVLTRTQLMRFCDINVAALEKACYGSCSADEDFKSNTNCYDIPFPTSFRASCYSFNEENDFCYIFGNQAGNLENICLLVNYEITTDSFSTSSSVLSSCWNVIGCELFPQLGVFLFTDQNEVIILCPYTLITMKKIKCEQILKDGSFQLVKSSTEPCLLLFGEQIVCYSLPNVLCLVGDVRYKLSAGTVIGAELLGCFQVCNQQDSNDNMDGIIYQEVSEIDSVKSVRINIIEEVQPEFRLERLLKKGRFQEAEKFAVDFNLDLEFVNQQIAVFRVNSLHSWDTSDTAYDSLFETLKKIKDVEFVVTCCLKVIVPNVETPKKLYNYGIERIKSAEEKTVSLNSLESQLVDRLMRLDTYVLLLNLSPNPVLSSNSYIDDWLKKVDLFSKTHEYVIEGKLSEASLIWCRHSNSFKDFLSHDIETSLKMITDIPGWTQPSDLLIWFEEFIPSLLLFQPDALTYFVQWILDRLKSLELSQRNCWPDIAINMCNKIMHIFEKFNEQDALPVPVCKPSDINSPINRLCRFFTSLNSLSVLKHVYSIHLTFDEFNKPDFRDIVFLLLHRCRIEKVTDFIQKFLRSVLLEQRQVNESSDKILCDFVEKFVNQLPTWVLQTNASWEHRVSAILNCVHNSEEFLTGVYCVASRAGIPWSETINLLVDKALMFDHPLVSKIKRELTLLPKKLLFKKYGHVNLCSLRSDYVEKLLYHIISFGKDDALNDALQLSSDLPEGKIYSQFIYCYIVSGRWSYEQVEDMMMKLPGPLVEDTWYRLGLFLTSVLRGYNGVEKVQLFIPFKNKILKYCEYAEKLFDSCCLQEEFGVKGAFSKIHRTSSRWELVETAALKLCEGQEGSRIQFNQNIDSDKAIEDIFLKIKRLAQLVGLPPKVAVLFCSQVFFKFWGPTERYLFLCNYLKSEAICFGSDDTDIDHIFEEVRKIAISLIEWSDTEINLQDPDVVRKSLFTVNKIIEICLSISSSSRTLNIGLELSRWLPFLSGFLSKSNEKVKSMACRNISLAIPKITKPFFTQYIYFANNVGNELINTTFKNYDYEHLPEELVHQMSNFRMNFSESVQHLIEGEDGFNVIKWLCHLYYSFSFAFHTCGSASQAAIAEYSKELFNEWEEIISDADFWNGIMNESISILLPKLTFQAAQPQYVLTLLEHLPRNVAIDWLRDMSEKETSRLNRIASIGIKYAELIKRDDLYQTFSKMYTTCKWISLLSLLGINVKDPFVVDKKTSVQQLVKHIPKKIDVTVLRDFCMDGKLDFQNCILVYIEHLILSWEPDIEIKFDIDGNPALFVKNDVEEILNHLKYAFGIAEDPSELLRYCARVIWPKVNGYYYEIYYVILDLVDYLKESAVVCDSSVSGIADSCKSDAMLRNILQFLKFYKRISPPSNEEKKEFLFNPYSSVSSITLSEIAKFRFPFTKILESDVYESIKPELGLKNYEFWLEIADLMEPPLQKDMICLFSIHESFLTEVKACIPSSNNEWYINPCIDTVLKAVEKCASHITDVETVCAIYYFVMKNLPPGADQVKAAELCYKSACIYYNDSKSEKFYPRFLKVQEKFLRSSTLHVLHKHKLIEQEYFQLAMNPEELIKTLYNHPIILTFSQSYPLSPDINSVAREISIIHKKDLKALKWKFVRDWLIPDIASDLNVTFASQMNFIPPSSQRLDSTNLTDDVKRACYVLSEEDMNSTCQYLWRMAVLGQCSFSERDLDYCARYKALQCLVRLANPEYILENFSRDSEFIRTYMNDLFFTSRLELVGWSGSLESFHAYEKELLVGQLLNVLDNHVVKLAIDICRCYKIDRHDFWNILINYLLKYKMAKELEEVLPVLEVQWNKLDPNIFNAAWNYVIEAILSQVEGSSSTTEVHSAVKKCTELIKRCPCLAVLDFNAFFKYCQKQNCNDLPEMKILKSYLLM